MNRCAFNEEKIIGILREYEQGLKTSELCRKYGMSDTTFHKCNIL